MIETDSRSSRTRASWISSGVRSKGSCFTFPLDFEVVFEAPTRELRDARTRGFLWFVTGYTSISADSFIQLSLPRTAVYVTSRRDSVVQIIVNAIVTVATPAHGGDRSGDLDKMLSSYVRACLVNLCVLLCG
jgi:hypothetical protein